MGTKRSMPLHNFTMPAGWVNQRLHRCIDVNSNGRNPGASDHQHGSENRIEQRRSTREIVESERGNGFCCGSPKVNRSQTRECDHGRRISNDDGRGSDGIGSTTEGVVFDDTAAVDKLKELNLKEGIEEGKVSVPPQLTNPAAESRKGNTCCPWNLRTRRTSCKVSANENDIATAADDGNGFRTDASRIDSGVPQMRVATAANSRKCNGSGAQRPKFSVSLSKREIEEDFLKMVGRRPPRRPKKRPRVVQRQLDTLFPGLWLIEVTPDMYRVPEAAP